MNELKNLEYQKVLIAFDITILDKKLAKDSKFNDLKASNTDANRRAYVVALREWHTATKSKLEKEKSQSELYLEYLENTFIETNYDHEDNGITVKIDSDSNTASIFDVLETNLTSIKTYADATAGDNNKGLITDKIEATPEGPIKLKADRGD